MRLPLRLLTAAIMLLLAAPAQAEWWEAETGHFVVKSRDSEEGTLEFALELERLDAALRTLLNLPVGVPEQSRSNKLNVYRFGSDRDIARMAGAPGSGIAGFYIAYAGQSVAFAPARQRINNSIRTRDRRGRIDELAVLKHEYIHFFMMQHFPAAYPRWYVEGYAEMMSTIYYKEDNVFHVGDPPQHRAYQVLEMSQSPLEEMLDSNHRLEGMDSIQHYGTGWLLSHYLNFNPDRLAQLHEFLVALGNGEDSLTAARRIFGDLNAMDEELRRYRREAFPGYDVRLADVNITDVTMRQLSPAEEDLIREEMRLRRGIGDEDDAADVLADARSNAADYPGNPHALLILALAEYEAENYAEADALAAQLTEQDPENIEALLIRTASAIDRIEDDPSQAEEARSYASYAAAIDRADPRPLILYYYSYLEAGEEPPEAAVIALEAAFETSGSDPTYRILLARQLVVENRLQSASTVLQPIAFRGHNQGDDEEEEELAEGETPEPSLTKLLRLITNGERDSALAMMDEMMEDEEDEEDGEA